MSTPEPYHRCELCGRLMPNLTVHHLKPRSRGKKGEKLPTALLCPACHRQLHAMFSNHQLAQEYSSLEELRAEPALRGFLKWVRKQTSGKRIKIRQSRNR